MVVWIVLAVVVIIGVVFALFGWDRYRGAHTERGVGRNAAPTGEVFVEPESGRRLRVWYDPDTGRREYRPEEPPDGARGAF